MMKVGNKVKVINKKNGFSFDTCNCCTKNIGKIGTITKIKNSIFYDSKLIQVFFEEGYNVYLKKDNTEEDDYCEGTWFLLSELKKVIERENLYWINEVS